MSPIENNGQPLNFQPLVPQGGQQPPRANAAAQVEAPMIGGDMALGGLAAISRQVNIGYQKLNVAIQRGDWQAARAAYSEFALGPLAEVPA